MSKKNQRHSLKKMPKDSSRYKDIQKLDLVRIIQSQEKFRSQRKVQSSQKNDYYLTAKGTIDDRTNFQTGKKGLIGLIDRSIKKERIKTQTDESYNNKEISNRIIIYENKDDNKNDKSIYQKILNLKKKKLNDQKQLSQKRIDVQNKFRQYQAKIIHNANISTINPNKFLQSKPKNSTNKKAFFLGQINLKNILKRPFRENDEMPLTCKQQIRVNSNERQKCGSLKKKKEEKNQKIEQIKIEVNNIKDRSQKKKFIQINNKKKYFQQIKNKNQKTIQKKININNLMQIRGKSLQSDQQDPFQQNHQDSFNLRTKSNIHQSKHNKKFLKTQPDHAYNQSQSNQPNELQTQKKNKIKKNYLNPTENPFDLSSQQLQTFGNRFPESFIKLRLLGRGGFSLVWLGQHKKSNKQFAIKQIKTQNTHQTHIKQIWFGTYFFEIGGFPKKQYSKHIGIRNLVKLYSYDINKKDTWIFYQKCGESLGNALYELKGENYNVEGRQQRVYRALYKPFYFHIKNNQNEIRRIVIEVAKALVLLNEHKIVHSDLKTQNILIKVKDLFENMEESKQFSGINQLNKSNTLIQQIKLIDYGSSFTFNNLNQFSMATPEYMAPQILNYILYQNQMQYAPKLLQFLKSYKNPWVIDVWSLGCVLLQIVSGIPLWMSLKTIVKGRPNKGNTNNELIKYGLFAIKGRLFNKIIKKQIEVVQNLDYYLNEQNYSGINLEGDLKNVLKRMLLLDPSQRITPNEIVKLLSQNLD